MEQFIKWAGGKKQLLNAIEHNLPRKIKQDKSFKFNYVEPFIGGGSVLFYLLNNYSQKINQIIINDLNTRLIETYRTIQKEPEALIHEIHKIRAEYNSITTFREKRAYFNKKKTKFNSLEIKPKNSLQLSSLFIFLNKTGYNGMYRENNKGEFNIPCNITRKMENQKLDLNSIKPSIYSDKNRKKFQDNILNISQQINQKRIEIHTGSYENILIPESKHKTLYYLDPPYMPLIENKSFTKYLKNDTEWQKPKSLETLLNYCEDIHKNGDFFMLSNAYKKTEEIDLKWKNSFNKLYNNKMFFKEIVYARRTINSKGKGRGKIKETIIRNYEI